MPTALSTKTSLRFTGEYVSRQYFEFLINGYSQMHPTEEKSVYIAREFIAAALAASPRVCGIRFVYGLWEGVDPRSRVVMLMGCCEMAAAAVRGMSVTEDAAVMLSTEESVAAAKVLLTAEGHLTHEGRRLSGRECARLSERYLDRMSELWPGESREELPRSCFFGAAILADLLAREDCAGIRFHFGYDAGRERLPLRYAVVLEAVDGVGQSLELFADHGSLCPPNCPPIPPDGPGRIILVEKSAPSVEAPLNMDLLVGGENGGALYEMYHHVSPVLIDAMQKQGLDHREIYARAFAEGFSLLTEGKTGEARAACKRSLETLMNQYLIHN